MLPEDWEGINGLYVVEKEVLSEEINRQMNTYFDTHGEEDYNIGSYTGDEFEETFNGDNTGAFNGTTYFMKIFY